MIIKVGTDLCDPERVERILRQFGKKFIQKILTNNEIELLDLGLNQRSFKPSLAHRLSARFAAKEAIAKLLGTGIGKDLAFHDIEILKNDSSSAPYIKLNENALGLASSFGFTTWDISISHEKNMSVAVVIAYGEKSN